MKTDLNIIIPIYNEEHSIKVVIEDWIQELEKLNITYRINLYNDGSTDNSLKEIKTLESNYPIKLKVIDKKNSGHGPTILKGYNENLDSDWVFQVDSDNEMKADFFNKMWNDRENYDFIIGERINRNSNLIRKLMSFTSHLVILTYYGKEIKDVNCPYRLLRTGVFKEIIKDIPKKTFAPNIIISGMAVKKKLKFKQYKINFEPRTTGTNSLGTNIFKLLKISFKSFLETIYYARKTKI